MCKKPGLNLIRKSLSVLGQIRSCIWAILHQIGMLLYIMYIYMLKTVLSIKIILSVISCRVEQAHENLKYLAN